MEFHFSKLISKPERIQQGRKKKASFYTQNSGNINSCNKEGDPPIADEFSMGEKSPLKIKRDLP